MLAEKILSKSAQKVLLSWSFSGTLQVRNLEGSDGVTGKFFEVKI